MPGSGQSPLRLYVHIPYCLHKCAYCDFNSHAQSAPPWADYLHALRAELRHWSAQTQFSGRMLASIYFGGGTPSLVPPALVAGVLKDASCRFGLADGAEISLEANPGAVDARRFTGYRAAGVNRLSIGVQSFHDDELAWLERIHCAGEAVQALAMARNAGFDNINLDLMYGLPGQTKGAWLKTLQTALNLKPEHLSCYQLTVEPHTLLAARHHQQPLDLPPDDESLDMFRTTRSFLEEAGYPPYEISNFARPGFYCRHNDGYWLYDDYIGIGAGACGKWNSEDGGIHRYTNVKSPANYITRAVQGEGAIVSEESRTPGQAAAEAVWLGLRRQRGIDRNRFTGRFGKDCWSLFSRQLQPWLNTGDLILTKESMRLNATGQALADSIALSVL